MQLLLVLRIEVASKAAESSVKATHIKQSKTTLGQFKSAYMCLHKSATYFQININKAQLFA